MLSQKSAEKEVGKVVADKEKTGADKEPVKKDKAESPSPKKAPAPAPPSAVVTVSVPEPALPAAPAPALEKEATPPPAAVTEVEKKLEVKVEEKEEDKLSDEGLGASSDEISDGSQVRFTRALFCFFAFISLKTSFYYLECIMYIFLLFDFIWLPWLI